MLRRNKTKVLVIVGVILFTVGMMYLLNIERRSGNSQSQQQHVQVPANPSLDSPSSEQHTLPDIVRVTHFAPVSPRQATPYTSPQTPTFEKTINDPAVVQKMYNAVLALPQEHSNVKLCTFNPSSVTNELRFFAGNKLVLHATVVVGGCGSWISIEGVNLHRSADSAFLSLLTNSLGVTRRELYEL
jgi:hypothetical protein